jgi:hypothetical protein
MPWTDPSTRATAYSVTATDWNALVNNQLFLAQVAYVEFTADVNVTATTVGTANQIVSAGAITYEAVPHYIEFYSPRWTAPAQTGNLILRDGTTVLGTLSQFVSSQNHPDPYVLRVLTPTAASHTYNVAAWLGGAGTGTMRAGTGGTAGDATTFLPGFIRITRIPT